MSSAAAGVVVMVKVGERSVAVCGLGQINVVGLGHTLIGNDDVAASEGSRKASIEANKIIMLARNSMKNDAKLLYYANFHIALNVYLYFDF